MQQVKRRRIVYFKQDKQYGFIEPDGRDSADIFRVEATRRRKQGGRGGLRR